ncbi:hypothetical protein E0W68_09555 [Flavobacterium salilacus subsp. salilacus]|uniref:hypothetical protein n=1 Tax=Flavobacterium TaxID=237 RepID=UPI0010750AB6|nr:MULTISPECIES: hypothetical protein [Flavobacterium]KAF2518260.1 hypothetical protein E0W68_09555 [Flavobacterium salilacus subsp. salilacus]MBE1615330.1 hypothetical protein [Flavobacterium sp. SaA2.13]
MSLLLYINGQRLDTDSKTVIAQTKQINDIGSLSDRQCNYTNKIKIPKTANNVKALNFTGVTGNTSFIPYQKNNCFLQSDNGQNFVYNGWANVSDAGDSYEIVVYDGIIDLFKAIENKSLSDLGLSEIDHIKTIENVTSSWSAGYKDYRYLVADYNGDVADSVNGEINIDYLVPSVWIPYLWNKIQVYLTDTLNEEVIFNGTLFQTLYFKLLYMSYPKGLATSDTEELKYQSDSNTFVFEDIAQYVKYEGTPSTYEIMTDINGVHLKVGNTGFYRIELSGTLYTLLNYKGSIKIGINADGIPAKDVISDDYVVPSFNSGQEFEGEIILFLEEGQFVSFIVAKKPNDNNDFDFSLQDTISNQLTANITYIVPNTISFTNVLAEFSVKDFLTEIVQRFGLTIFKDPYSHTYTFMTMEEFIQNAEYVDWSDKYINKKSENYVLANYAQKNYFRYKYNDSEGAYKDGYITINNINLPEKKDIIKSKMYSPERFPVTYFGSRLTNTYKLWEKEITENEGETEISYKQLESRFYIINADYETPYSLGLPGNFNVISKQLNQLSTSTGAYFENFGGQSFPEIIQNFYQPLNKLLQTSKIIEAEMWLSETDIVNFDFKKLYYIKQLSNYFIVNKIKDYVSGKPTKVELIRVLYAGEEDLSGFEFGILWYSAVQSSQYEYTLNYHLLYTPQAGTQLTFEVSDNGTVWNNSEITTSNYSTYFINLENYPDTQYIRIYDPISNAYSDSYFL